MISKAQSFMQKQLQLVSKIYDVPLLTEVKEGSKKYDFYFPTNPPITIEVNGIQHEANKVDGFFFKSTEQLLNYKRNDSERKKFNLMGKIILIEYSDQEFPTLSEILEDLKEYDAIKILEQGVDEKNAYYSRIIYNQRKSERRKEQNKKFREQLKKQKSNSWNRLK